jgi:hypothetical protein
LPHKRSRKAHIRRVATNLMLRIAFWDREKAETISTVNRSKLIEMLSERISGEVQTHFVPDVESGEVLMDRRGQGSLQRADLSKREPT